jgi:hypothetical protein
MVGQVGLLLLRTDCALLLHCGRSTNGIAPVMHPCHLQIFYILFLGLFSFVLLVDYFPWRIEREQQSTLKMLPLSITEIVLHVFMWTLILEELCQVRRAWRYRRAICFPFAQFYRIKWRYYLSNAWNWIDATAIVLYLIGFATRFFVDEVVFTVSK